MPDLDLSAGIVTPFKLSSRGRKPRGDTFGDLLPERVGTGTERVKRPQDLVGSGTQPRSAPATPPQELDLSAGLVNRRPSLRAQSTISHADLEKPVYETQRGQPATSSASSDELRVMKGEQPVDRQGYSRQQDAQTRLSQMRDESYQEKQVREAKDVQWRADNQPEIDRQTKLYRQDIQKAKASGDPNKWVAEFGTKVAGRLLELAPGDAAKIHSEAALQAAEAEGADRSQLSQGAQNIAAGFVGSAPELGAMALGTPPIATFAAGSAIRSKSSDPMEIARAAGQGGLTGAAFDLPGIGEGVTKVLTGSAATGLGTAGIDLASGASPKEAAISGVTNAIMRGAPEAVRLRARGRVDETATIPTTETITTQNGTRDAQGDQRTQGDTEQRAIGLSSDAGALPNPDVAVEPHHSSTQPRRTRNTEHGARGQFKKQRVRLLNADEAAEGAKPRVRLLNDPQSESAVTLTPRQQGVRSFPETLESTGREGGTDRNYDVFTDKDSRARADKRIADNPQAALDYVMQGNAAPETESGKERIVTGLKLADQLSTKAESSTDPVDAAEKHAKAIDLYTKLSVDLTSAGQTVQAASQARKYSREGAPLEVARIAKVKGETPKPEDVSAVREMAKRQDDLESRLTAVQSQIESMKAQVKSEPKARTSRPKLESLTDRLGKMETEARARLEARVGKAGSGAVQPLGGINVAAAADIADYAIIGAAKLARKGVTLASWTNDMVKEFGEDIKPHLEKVFVASKKLRDEHAAALKEESTARGAAKASKSIEDYRQERYELQTQKRLNARDMDRKFRELEMRNQGGLKGAALKTDAIASTLLRDGLLSFHGLFNILSGMSAKQAIDTAARIPESALDIARVRGAQIIGKTVPRTSAGLSVRGLAESTRYLATEGPRNVGKSLAGRPSEIMPETFRGPFDNPYANGAIGPMGKLYGAKESIIRSWAYPTERQNQARVFASNDMMDGVIKRGGFARRVNDYLNGRAEIEGARNKTLVKSLAESAADYEIKNHDTIPSAKALRVKELINNPSQLIDAVAGQYADRQVYAEPLGERMQKLQRGLKGGLGKTGEAIILPFLKRPANSIKDLLYTYTGARVPVEAVRNTFGRGWGPAEIKSMNQAVSRGSAGPAIFTLGFALAAKGMLTSLNDKQHPGSLKIGSSYYAISRVPVIGWLLTAGATAKIDGGKAVPGALVKMIAEHPLLRGVKNVATAVDEGVQAAEGNTKRLGAAATSFASKTLARFIPTPLAAIAETMDTQTRDTRSLLGPTTARIPVARESLPAQGQKERGSAFDPFLGYPARQSQRKRGTLKF